jgi:ATP-dependent Lon protease
MCYNKEQLIKKEAFMKNNLPVIILKGIVLLPNCDIRIEFDNDYHKSILDVSELFHDNKVLVVVKENDLEETSNIKKLPKIGVIAKISHKIELPNGKVRLILTGIKRAKILEYLTHTEKDNILESIILPIEKEEIDSKKENVYVKKLKSELKKYIDLVPYASNSILSSISNIESLDVLTDEVSNILNISNERMKSYLYELSSKIRLEMILNDLEEVEENYEIERELDSKVKKVLDENQREFLLKEKLKIIKQELKETTIKDDEVTFLKKKLESLQANANVKKRISDEINRFEAMSQLSPEVSIIRNYIDYLLELPWEEETIDNDNLIEARAVLDKSHNGLEKIKTRIIEYLAVKQMKGNLKSPIICLVGPPGVGKTSLAFSIAEAMNRKFVKISVGGINDEAEIIGHRRTYLGSAPGRIIQGIKKAGSKNPVFLIDEIDKMTRDYKGDPASTLLGILDPEQNKYFSDNYIEEEFDLSKVVFITTANYVEQIPEALKDRLEIIYLSGYTEYEKLDIAKKYLLPRICKEHGVNVKGIQFKEDALLKVIRSYTRESGVRELERQLSKIIRKIVTQIVIKKVIVNKFIIDSKKVEEFLGKEIYYFSKNDTKEEIGIVNGLSYTYYGGDIQKIEVNYFKGKGLLVLTGSMGEVMKESALIALNYIKANHKEFGINYKLLEENDIHIHVPECSVKKEGPSAGVAITSAIISALTNKKINKKIAMTGEITLRGNILKIGGLKEKTIGAHRNGIKKIIIPSDNLVDTVDIPEDVLKDIEFITVKNYKEVFSYLLKEG